uniref:Formyl-CoA transferase n=1 Tax=uncultured bacterium 5E7 TaxID=1701324 RepID=A0A0N7F2B1_9BACT|nr:Formyl-CoA transferase [uncultured bacterium 5E7]
MGALDGLKVIDLTQMYAGPGTGMLLSDQGADVIKIEPPNGGRDRTVDGGGTADTFLLLNRGKRSLILDLRTEQGKEVLRRLAARSDVMLVAWPPGQAEKLGCGYEAMHALNPRLVYASITGWGETGPLAQWPGYDRLHQAHTGMMDRNRGPDGAPLVLPFFAADQAIPFALCYGIMLALWQRERTGLGQKVETSQLDLMIAIQSLRLVFREDDTGPRREEFPGHIYLTKDDRWITLVPILDSEWARLWDCLGLADLAADERLRRPAGRLEHDGLIRARLAERFREKTLAEWLALTEPAGLPVAAVHTGAEFIDHPHAWQNGMLAERQHPVHGRVRMMNTPVRLSDSNGEAGWPPPGFGEHSREILAELGFDEADIAAMERDGVTGQH